MLTTRRYTGLPFCLSVLAVPSTTAQVEHGYKTWESACIRLHLRVVRFSLPSTLEMKVCNNPLGSMEII